MWRVSNSSLDIFDSMCPRHAWSPSQPDCLESAQCLLLATPTPPFRSSPSCHALLRLLVPFGGRINVPGPLTLRMMERVWSSMNSTRTWVTPPREPIQAKISLPSLPNPSQYPDQQGFPLFHFFPYLPLVRSCAWVAWR